MKHARGFTLIEVMTALMVLGILFAVAIPNFREMTRSNRVAGAQNDLVTALAVARNEAIHQSTTVAVCASANGTTCSGLTDWTSGWIVFTDSTGTAGTLDGSDAPLQKWGILPGETKVTGTAAFLRYASTGMLTPSTARSFNVYYTGCVGAKLRNVSVGVVGSTTTTKQACP